MKKGCLCFLLKYVFPIGIFWSIFFHVIVSEKFEHDFDLISKPYNTYIDNLSSCILEGVWVSDQGTTIECKKVLNKDNLYVPNYVPNEDNLYSVKFSSDFVELNLIMYLHDYGEKHTFLTHFTTRYALIWVPYSYDGFYRDNIFIGEDSQEGIFLWQLKHNYSQPVDFSNDVIKYKKMK